MVCASAALGRDPGTIPDREPPGRGGRRLFHGMGWGPPPGVSLPLPSAMSRGHVCRSQRGQVIIRLQCGTNRDRNLGVLPQLWRDGGHRRRGVASAPTPLGGRTCPRCSTARPRGKHPTHQWAEDLSRHSHWGPFDIGGMGVIWPPPPRLPGDKTLTLNLLLGTFPLGVVLTGVSRSTLVTPRSWLGVDYRRQGCSEPSRGVFATYPQPLFRILMQSLASPAPTTILRLTRSRPLRPYSHPSGRASATWYTRRARTRTGRGTQHGFTCQDRSRPRPVWAADASAG